VRTIPDAEAGLMLAIRGRGHRAGALATGLAALLALSVPLVSAAAAAAADRFAGVEVVAHPVSGNVHMLVGAGGNIGVSIGADGTLIIDDQFAPLAERILQALDRLGGDRPKLILNTHFHGDHTGGNPFFGTTGTIVAHDNVRVRLAADDGFPAPGLPVLTFQDRVRVHFNDDTIEVIHFPAGHTDGDSVVWFRDANVLHMGDLLFNGLFPFIDLASGGSVEGVIANLSRILEMVPDDIRIIPGHGPLAGRGDLQETLTMIRETRATVLDALGSGRSVDEVVAAGLGPQWTSWGVGFINEERWIRTLAAAPGGR
jgi:cyclase